MGRALIAVVQGRENGEFPPIVAATFVYQQALRLQCDRIRVERLDGVRVADFPTETVGRFIARYRLIPQPGRAAVEGRDWETHRPVWPGMTRQPAAKEN